MCVGRRMEAERSYAPYCEVSIPQDWNVVVLMVIDKKVETLITRRYLPLSRRAALKADYAKVVLLFLMSPTPCSDVSFFKVSEKKDTKQHKRCCTYQIILCGKTLYDG